MMKRCQLKVAEDYVTAGDACANIMSYINEVSGGIGMDEAEVYSYDNRIFAYDWDPYE